MVRRIAVPVLGLGLVVELDVGDAPDRLAADPHLVALHELAGVLEDHLDLVGVAAAEQRQRDQRDGSDQCRGRENSRQRRASLTLERLASPSLSFF